MKKFIFISVLLPFLSYAQGLNMSTPEEIASSSIAMPTEYGYSSTSLPSSHDMLQYAPPVKVQKGGTCVGFAAGYCAQSTMLNKSLGITNPYIKSAMAMDPYFIYSIDKSVNKVTSPCEDGLTFSQYFKALESIGNMRQAYPPSTNCSFNWNDYSGELNEELLDNFAASYPYRLDDYDRIELDDSGWLSMMKYFLANDIPVIVGAGIDEDFENLMSSGYGLWTYKAEQSQTIGGHAMCVLGYNDYKYGGAFLVRNSWGDSFGDNGNLWIKYSDFRNVVAEAWVMYPDDSQENYSSSADYSFDIKSTGMPGLIYKLIKTSGGDIYEGFYAEGKQVWAFHLSSKGGLYFGQFIDYAKHGYGYVITPIGEKFQVRYENDVLVDAEELGFSSGKSKLEEDFMANNKSNTDKLLYDGDIPQFRR